MEQQLIASLVGTKGEETKRKVKTLFDNKNRRFLTTEQVAEYLHISVRTVYDWRQHPERYRLPVGFFVKLGRRLLIDCEVLESWIIARR
jgi:predicted DNA-binding transcriptional regulator AlpA